MHAQSDLDLLIRCPQPQSRQVFAIWQEWITRMSCRTDTQIETPAGAFSLAEWLRYERVLLKTNHGPVLVRDPWRREDGR